MNKYIITPTNTKQIKQHDFRIFEFAFFFHEDSIYSIEVNLLELYQRDFAHTNIIF